ncbi:hypothetical protein ACJRO7_014684, partial [Eucalyptus globulus]
GCGGVGDDAGAGLECAGMAEFFVGWRNHCKWRCNDLKASGILCSPEQKQASRLERRDTSGSCGRWKGVVEYHHKHDPSSGTDVKR